MKKNLRKTLAIICTLAMIIALVPATALASEAVEDYFYDFLSDDQPYLEYIEGYDSRRDGESNTFKGYRTLSANKHVIIDCTVSAGATVTFGAFFAQNVDADSNNFSFYARPRDGYGWEQYEISDVHYFDIATSVTMASTNWFYRIYKLVIPDGVDLLRIYHNPVSGGNWLMGVDFIAMEKSKSSNGYLMDGPTSYLNIYDASPYVTYTTMTNERGSDHGIELNASLPAWQSKSYPTRDGYFKNKYGAFVSGSEQYVTYKVDASNGLNFSFYKYENNTDSKNGGTVKAYYSADNQNWEILDCKGSKLWNYIRLPGSAAIHAVLNSAELPTEAKYVKIAWSGTEPWFGSVGDIKFTPFTYTTEPVYDNSMMSFLISVDGSIVTTGGEPCRGTVYVAYYSEDGQLKDVYMKKFDTATAEGGKYSCSLEVDTDENDEAVGEVKVFFFGENIKPLFNNYTKNL